MKGPFQVHDGAIPFVPDVFFVAQLFREPLAAENFRMHSNDQHFLAIRTIEYADPPTFGESACGAPEKVMFQFVGARLFETRNLAALQIDPGHDVADGAVLACGVHPLKNQEQRVAVGCVVKLLQRTFPCGTRNRSESIFISWNS